MWSREIVRQLHSTHGCNKTKLPVGKSKWETISFIPYDEATFQLSICPLALRKILTNIKRKHPSMVLFTTKFITSSFLFLTSRLLLEKSNCYCVCCSTRQYTLVLAAAAYHFIKCELCRCRSSSQKQILLQWLPVESFQMTGKL